MDKTEHEDREYNDDSESSGSEDPPEENLLAVDFEEQQAQAQEEANRKKKKRKRGNEDEKKEEKKKVELIDIEFGIWDPSPNDFYPVKHVTQTYTEREDFDSSGFADLISGQVTVGGMIKAGEETLGFITALNMHQNKDLKCIQDIKKYFLSKCNKRPEIKTQYLNLINNAAQKPLGLLMNERVLNVPNELVPPLQRSLQLDIAWAQENEETQELKNSFKFQNYLMVVRCFESAEAKAEASTAPPAKKKKKKKKQKSVLQPNEGCFHWEEAVYLKHATWMIRFDSAEVPEDHKSSGVGSVKQCRYLAAIPHSKIPVILQQIDELFMTMVA